jgi:hypothetical protein
MRKRVFRGVDAVGGSYLFAVEPKRQRPNIVDSTEQHDCAVENGADS